METLQARLESVQSSQLDIIERESDAILDSIEFWQLVKEEHLILHAARQKGYTRLGLQPVPTLQVSEANAKGAIEMALVLQSLASSKFGRESWSLRATSRELYDSNPKYCLKKGGSHVHVRWDGDKANESEYTAWDFIYCQTESGAWQKFPGYVDYRGLFYEEDGIRLYYEDFEQDAHRFSKSRYWEVYYMNKLVSPVHPPIRTSRSSSQEAGTQSPHSEAHQPATSTPKTAGGGRLRGRRGRPPPTRATPPAPSPPERHSETPGSGARNRLRGRGGTTPRVRRGRKSNTTVRPRDVGRVHKTVQAHGLTRVERLAAEAGDPHLLVFAGQPNSLKCLRYRLKGLKGLYTAATNNFKWVEGVGQGSGARMVFAFESLEQRKAFEKQARFPPSVSYFYGNFESL